MTVPSRGPSDVSANATSSTTVVVLWGDIPVQDQNGLIEGYKVCYAAVLPPPRPEHKKVECQAIPSNQTHTITLTELRKYVVYQIQVLGYTRLGDGALSDPPVTVRTFEDSKYQVPFGKSKIWFNIVIFDKESEMQYKLNLQSKICSSLNYINNKYKVK